MTDANANPGSEADSGTSAAPGEGSPVAQDTRPEVPVSGVIYGELVYWITILGSIIAIVGATMAMFGAQNYLDPSYVFSAIWEGKSTVEIWEGAIGQIPNGHWYLPRLSNGDALAMFGLALGVFSVIPGMIGAAIVMYRKKDILFGTFTMVAVLLCIISLLGLIRMPSQSSGSEAEEAGEVRIEGAQPADSAIS